MKLRELKNGMVSFMKAEKIENCTVESVSDWIQFFLTKKKLPSYRSDGIEQEGFAFPNYCRDMQSKSMFNQFMTFY